MDKKDVKANMKVKYPETRFCSSGVGVVDKSGEGKTGKIPVNVSVGTLYFDAKDLTAE